MHFAAIVGLPMGLFSYKLVWDCGVVLWANLCAVSEIYLGRSDFVWVVFINLIDHLVGRINTHVIESELLAFMLYI